MQKILAFFTTAIGVGVIAFIAIILLGFPVMLLWNWLMPEIFGLKEINFWQAIGIQVLAYLIFPKSSNSSNKSK